MSTSSRYAGRGVSSSKEDVHAAIKNIDKGLYPKAFCKIIPDRLAGDPEACLIMHADRGGHQILAGLRLLARDGPTCRCGKELRRMPW